VISKNESNLFKFNCKFTQQREQLKSLREKILSQKNEVTTKIIKVDKQIQSLEKTKTEGSQMNHEQN